MEREGSDITLFYSYVGCIIFPVHCKKPIFSEIRDYIADVWWIGT